MTIKPIVIVAGEPKSIFFEIFFKSMNKKINSPIILICCKKILVKQIKYFEFKKKVNFVDFKNITKNATYTSQINIIDVPLKITKKHSSEKVYINRYIDNCFNLAFLLIKKKISNKFINGPIDKEKFLNKKFVGITEYVSNKFKNSNTAMLIYNKKLSVCPVTTHLPIKLVSKKITQSIIINKLKIIDQFFVKKLKLKPKIAVTGLNPHCESILDKNEDIDIIEPAIKKSRKQGINSFGPFPGDTIFLKQNRNQFNVILGMYHDQVISPIKTLYEYDAINITMGLPFFRVTPDHGPNQKMINKNNSNPMSLIRALEFLDKN